MPLIKHERDDVGDFQRRVLMHIPIGLLISIPVLGWPLLYLFVKYERNEDLHTEDEAWKDICGGMVGAVIGILIEVGILGWLFCARAI